jgi:acyl-[acyl-carrier-protein]-phospholipid O-acyltransferase/long-chain-fatty-acid--[acyl-carrier-protein] ligase
MDIPVFSRRSCLPWPIEIAVGVVAKILYRVRTIGREHVPASGGVLILPNHLSYIDALIIQMACPRRLRFVAHDQLKHHWFFDWVLRISGAIIVSPNSSLESTRRIIKALKAGEAVCLFPEGAISRTGQLMEIHRSFELMALKANVPVVPVVHDGLWGSVFSFSGNKYLFKSPRLSATHVCVCFGQPLKAVHADAARVRREMLDLGSVAFAERPVLKRHLGREVVRSLAKRPRHIEIIDRTAERREVTAGRLLGVAAALSRRIRARVRGRRVGIVLPPGAGATIANLAVVCAGKIPVNLNFTAGRSAVEASMELAEIKTVISAEVMKVKFPNFPWPEDTLDLRSEIDVVGKGHILFWLAAVWTLPNQLIPVLLGLPKNGGEQEASLLFTSGSSGEPKGVVLTHRNLLANCWQISSLSILPDTATVVACLPLFHSIGSTVTLWYMMLRGCRVVTVPGPLDTRKIVDAVREESATVLIGAPSFLRPLLKKAEPGELRSLELVVSGAEKLPLELYDAFMERFHIEILQGYGLTETTPVTNINQPDPPITTSTAEHQPGKRLGSVGRMMPGLTARIIDPDTKDDLPLTETGMLLLRGANVFGGYLHDEAKTAAAFRDGWLVTGDLARFDEAGFLHIEGRLSRFAKIAGEMVPLATVEQKLTDGLGWEQIEAPKAIVVSVPDSARGEALILVTTEEVSCDAVRDTLTVAGLPNLWIPKIILRVECIPMLGTGKVDFKTCRDLALDACAVKAPEAATANNPATPFR